MKRPVDFWLCTHLSLLGADNESNLKLIRFWFRGGRYYLWNHNRGYSVSCMTYTPHSQEGATTLRHKEYQEQNLPLSTNKATPIHSKAREWTIQSIAATRYTHTTCNKLHTTCNKLHTHHMQQATHTPCTCNKLHMHKMNMQTYGFNLQMTPAACTASNDPALSFHGWIMLALVLQHSKRLALFLQHSLVKCSQWFATQPGQRLAMVLQHSGRLAMFCNTVESSRCFCNTVDGSRCFWNTVEGCKKIKSIAINKTWPNRQLQCSKRLPSVTFLQTCELQASKETHLFQQHTSLLLQTVRWHIRHLIPSNFKRTELLELDLRIFQAIDVRVSKEMPWRPTVSTWRTAGVWNAVCDKIQAECDRRVHPI